MIRLKNENIYSFEKFDVLEKTLQIDEVDWTYTVSGFGEQVILAILANISGHLLALPLAEEFLHTHKIIALSVPPIQNFSQTAEGLKGVLDYEKVSSCNALGHSNGGVYMQNLISKYPSYVEKIVFSHSLTSMSENDVYTVNQSEIKVYKTMRKILKIFPVSLLTVGMQKTFISKLKFKSSVKDTEQLIGLCKKDMKKLTKSDFLTMANCMEDFLYNYIFTSDPYLNKSQNVLIIDSESDKLANSMQRKEMLRLCPNAQEYHFATGGHVTMLTQTEEYISVIKKFWKS